MRKIKAVGLLLLSTLMMISCGESTSSNETTSQNSQTNTTSNETTSNGGSTTSGDKTSTSSGETTSATSEETSSSSPATSSEVIANYDGFCDEWSQSGHLYIHYLRSDATSFQDYEKYGLWLWEAGKAGALFAGANAPENIHPATDSWIKNIGGRGTSVDQAGVCADIDLSKTYVSGQTGSAFSLKDVDKIGYLVVEIASMKTGNVGWVKDGTDNYITEISSHKRNNGSIHVFLVAKSTEYYRHFYDESIYVNPTNNDTTGQYRSVNNIESSLPYNKEVTTSKEFYNEAGIGYEIFVPTFRDSNGDGYGDLKGIIDSLDYLKNLSVKVLWLSPFLECNSYHGYDTIDYFNVDPKFGTKDDLNELIYKVHQNGMFILMDLVLNHASTQSLLFKKARQGETGVDRNGNKIEYRNFFHFKYKGDITSGTTKVENDSNWIRDGESNYYYYAKFSDDMPEFNYDYQGTRDYVLDVAKYYLGLGVDGYRLDAIKHIYMADESTQASGDSIITDAGERSYYDEERGQNVTVSYDYSTNTTKNISFWKYFSRSLKVLYPNCYIVGENFDGWDERIAPVYSAMDSQFDFNNYYHNLEYLYGGFGHSAGDLATATNAKANYFKTYRSDFINSPFTSNHDISRAINHINSYKETELGIEKDVKITGTALQINKAKIHAAITLLQPGLSFIYYGDELGMSSNTTENPLSQNNNLDRYYRQSFKWADSSLRPLVSFGSQYTNEYDSYNKTLADNVAQANDSASMLSFYKGITAVKQDPTYPRNAIFTGYPYNDNGDVFYFTLAGNGTSTKNYRIFIHTGGNNGTSNSISYSVSANEEVVYKYNASDTTLNAFGVVVVREK